MRVHNPWLFVLACAAAPWPARAGVIGTIKHMDAKPESLTDWSVDFDVPQFDTLGGKRTLLSVQIDLFAAITSSAAAENLEANEKHISLNIEGQVSLGLLDQTLIVAIIQRGTAYLADPFDGEMDFMGPSGTRFDLSGDAFESTTLTDPEDLAPFIGPGLRALTVMGESVAKSSAAGGGNLAVEFQTLAGAAFSVTYTYIPSPGALGLLALGAGPVVAVRRRRNAA